MRNEGWVSSEIQESIAVKSELRASCLSTILRMAEVIVGRVKAGHKLLIFGNGGSAADAQHIAAEFVGRYRAERSALPAVALTTDTSALTAIGNDYGFEEVFARQIAAVGAAGDVAIGISTSGNSKNVLRALEEARRRGMFTIGMTGRTGGKMKGRVDLCLCVPSDATPRTQEAHMLVGHILSAAVEQAILDSDRHKAEPLPAVTV